MAGLRKRATNDVLGPIDDERDRSSSYSARRQSRLANRRSVAVHAGIPHGGRLRRRHAVVNKPPDESNLRGIVRVYAIAARDLGRPPQEYGGDQGDLCAG